jgi:ubiquinone/menaquinone biosynthesis C-methylase UbiE
MHDRRFKPSEAHRLENPERLVWLPPSEVLAHMDLKPGMAVADVGAGTGYFAVPIARSIFPDGKVFAVDVEPEMLGKLRDKLTVPGSPTNIELLQGESAQTNLRDGACDRVLFANVWHELEDPAGALKEMRRILRPSGRLVIVDWRPDVERPPGPPIEHRVAPERINSFLSSHDWRTEESCHIGQYSYLIAAAPPRDS